MANLSINNDICTGVVILIRDCNTKGRIAGVALERKVLRVKMVIKDIFNFSNRDRIEEPGSQKRAADD